MDALDGLRLNIPETKEGQLSFAEPDKDSVHVWVQTLPKTNLGEMAKQTFQALKELNQITLKPALRCSLLEQIRPSIHYITQQLRQHSLKQSIDLTAKQSRIASLIQTLYNQLIVGYKLCVSNSIPKPGVKPDEHMALAIHRAITDSGYQFLLSDRLYRSPQKGLWLETHTLYKIAAGCHLTEKAMTDTGSVHNQQLTVEQCYIRCLLLHTCSPAQLRPRQIRYVFEALELWVSAAEISRELDKCTFIIQTETDQGPEYLSLAKQSPSHGIGLNTTSLAEQLNAVAKGESTKTFTIPKNINSLIINHISLTLESNRTRQHERQVADGKVQVIAGITAAHFHMAGRIDFDNFNISHKQTEAPKEKTVFKEQTNDIWADVHDAEPVERSMPEPATPLQFNNASSAQSSSSDYPVHSAHIINISPSGYCLNWSSGLPTQIQNGEVVGVREDTSDNWNLAIIRWIKVEPGEQTLTGIELMAPNARPAAATMLHKTQDSSHFMRCFVLPESPALGHAASLIMPSLPFQAGCKILLQDHDEVRRAQLNECISSTASISQFTYKCLMQPSGTEPTQASPQKPDDGAINDTETPAADDDKWTLL